MISGSAMFANAANLDTIGVTLLRTIDPGLTGSEVNVAQAESAENLEGTAWQVDPFAIGQPANLFTYLSIDGSASNYPNALGIGSGHATAVGGNFFGTFSGVASGVAHVDNYEGNYFYETKIVPGISIQAKVVNQSFIFGSSPPQTTVDAQYDNFAALNNVLFVSGVGNSGAPHAPATAYNGIGVGVSDAGTSIGPTTDNGRSKPDISAPGGATSFSTPYVAGAAAILRQAGLRGDGGAGTTSSSTDLRTIKCLLLNGAVKPANWTHTTGVPLDARFGAGILNVFNSWKQLAAGKFSFIEATSNASGGSHFPTGNTNNVASLTGWDFNSLSNDTAPARERVNHYYFDTGANLNSHLIATLVWNRPFGQSSANNLDLFLYDVASSTLVASSISTVDNVEHLFVPDLPPGRYDLQVLKRVPAPLQSSEETYALAFGIFSTALQIARTGNQLEISWPIFPAGFRLQSASDLNPPISWSDVPNVPTVTNDRNRVTLSASSSEQFFRLVQP